MIRLTIFTPTYNRAYILPKLYESLKGQTNKDFIWLVIDDGSTDNTEEVVNKWKNDETTFEINYVKKENGGKNTAIDLSNQICTTDYIVCIDSDDQFSSGAVEDIYKEIDIVGKMEDVCGIVTRRAHFDGNPFGQNWTNEEYEKLYFYELGEKYNYWAETCLVFKTNIAKQYHFPTIKGEKFITESVYYNQFMYKYKMLVSKNIYYYAEYIADGYTNQGMKLFYKNPKGYLYSIKQNLYYARKLKKSLKSRLGLASLYYAWKNVCKIKDEFVDEYKIPFMYKFFGVLLSPIQVVKYKKKRKK